MEVAHSRGSRSRDGCADGGRRSCRPGLRWSTEGSVGVYDQWDVDEFENIAASESRHMTSVKRLLDRYGLADPVSVDVPGVFADADLWAAYDSLVAQGMQSLEDAFKMGVAIEELDIADLKELIALSAHRDVTRVAERLLRGSENHLAALTKLLEQ